MTARSHQIFCHNDCRAVAFKEITMANGPMTKHFPRATTRAMRVSAAEAERQLTLALWLVAFLVAATFVTATVGLFA
jgi:hypothetical protein